MNGQSWSDGERAELERLRVNASVRTTPREDAMAVSGPAGTGSGRG